jgi:hypothetical protein
MKKTLSFLSPRNALILTIVTVVFIFYYCPVWNNRAQVQAYLEEYSLGATESDKSGGNVNGSKPRPIGKILVLTIATGNIWYAPLVKKNREIYCQKHGYDLRFFESLGGPFQTLHPDSTSSVLHPSWGKIYEAMRVLDDTKSPRYEWIFFADLDLLVMNKNFKLESVVSQAVHANFKRDFARQFSASLNITIGALASHVDMIVARDGKGFNLGSFILRNSNFSRQLLARIWSRRHDASIKRILTRWEQAVFQKLYAEWGELRNHVEVVPQSLINAYPRPGGQAYRPSDLAMHFPGSNKKYLGAYLKLLVKSDPEYLAVDRRVRGLHCKDGGDVSNNALRAYCEVSGAKPNSTRVKL